MAIISGRYGKVTFAGTTGASTYVKSWTMDYNAELYDATNFDESSGGRSYVAGIPGWSGSFETFYSTGNTIAPGTSGAVILQTTTDDTRLLYTGGAILMTMTVNTPVDGLVTQNYTFQGLGTPASSI